MSDASFTRPDVLVLAGGGVLGESWMNGVLAGLEDSSGLDLRGVESLVGTSAGSIVAARLVGGRSPRRPGQPSSPLPAPDAAATDADEQATRGAALPPAVARLLAAAVSPLADPALTLEAPAGALVRAGLLARVPRGTRSLDDLESYVEHIGPRFDGRLRVCAVDLANGRRVVFGSPGAPPATVARAVIASCAIPGYFRPVEIGGRTYVDGGAWSHTNLDAAPVGRGTEVLCLDTLRGVGAASGAPFALLRNVWQSRARLEALALERRGARVQTIGPDADAEALVRGGGVMDPTQRHAILDAGYRQGLELGRG